MDEPTLPPPVPVRIKKGKSKSESTNTPLILDDALMKNFLQEAALAGQKVYTERVAELIGKKQFLTETHLRKYHDDIRQSVVNELCETYALLKSSTLLDEAKNTLDTHLNLQWQLTKTKYDNEIEDLLQFLKNSTTRAEAYYDENMEQCSPSSTNLEEALRKHSEAKANALKLHDDLLNDKEVDYYSSYRLSLERMLENREEDIKSSFVHPPEAMMYTDSQKRGDYMLAPSQDLTIKDESLRVNYSGKPQITIVPPNDTNSSTSSEDEAAGMIGFVGTTKYLNSGHVVEADNTSADGDNKSIDLIKWKDDDVFHTTNEEVEHIVEPTGPPYTSANMYQQPTRRQNLSLEDPHASDELMLEDSNKPDNQIARNHESLKGRHGKRNSAPPVPTFMDFPKAVNPTRPRRTSVNSIEKKRIDLGIYVDEGGVQIGYLDSARMVVERLITQHHPVDLTFTDPKITSTPARKEFNIHELMKWSMAEPFEVKIKNNRVKMTAEKLLESIFGEMISKAELKSSSKVFQIVITTSFCLNSAEKLRIRSCVNRAGYQSVRIVSQLMALSLVHRHEKLYFPKPKESKNVLFVCCQPLYFSVGVVKMGHYTSKIRSYHVSENVAEAIPAFNEAYTSLYVGTVLDQDNGIVRNVFLKTWKLVLKDVPRQSINEIVYVNVQAHSPLSQIIEEFFDFWSEKSGVVTRIDPDPLLGICVFASKTHLAKQTIPEQLEFLDSHRSKLTLLCNNKVVHKVKKSQVIKKGFIFCTFVDIALTDNSLVLLEQFYNGGKSYTIDAFKITAERVAVGKEGRASVHCRMDNDGVISVKIAFDSNSIKRQIISKLSIGKEVQISESTDKRHSLHLSKLKFSKVSKLASRVGNAANSLRRPKHDSPAGLD